MRPSFAELMKRWHCRPIRHCPGRYVLAGCPAGRTPEQLLDGQVEVASFAVPAARDRVFVAALEGGGLISYQRKDGTFMHTLGDESGFRRKLEALQISI